LINRALIEKTLQFDLQKAHFIRNHYDSEISRSLPACGAP